MIRLMALCCCLGLVLAFPVVFCGCTTTTTTGGGDNGGGGEEPECTTDEDCAAGQVCVGGVCVASGDEEPDSLIIAGSRTGHYVIVDPTTGEDLAEVAPATLGTNTAVLGYMSERAYFLSAPTTGTGQLQIFGCDAMTGDNLVQVTNLVDLGASEPDGSPVAPQLVFSGDSDDDGLTDNNIHVINEDGTGLVQLTHREDPLTLLDGTAVLSLGEYVPAWSPNGAQIAYQTRVGKVDSIGMQYEAVVVMDADGSNQRVIYDRQGSAHFRTLCWSHDGNFVVFSDEEDGRQVRAVSVASLTVSTLTDALVTDTGIREVWMSPDDMTIVFNYNVPGGGQLYTAGLQMAGDTVAVSSGPTQLTLGFSVVGHDYADPDWAPAVEVEGPECTSDEDCAAGQVCVDGVCVAAGEDDPDTLIVAGSRTHTYVIVNPDTGEDIVEVVPDTIGTNEPILGYQCARVYFLSAPTTGSGRADIFGCDAMTGENVVNLTADLVDFSAATPEGSPVEAKLVFTETYDNHVYVINEDGTGLTQVTFAEQTHTLLDGTLVESLGQYIPTWSPDGTRIAYQARVGEVDNIGMQYEVVIVMDADGSNQELIYDRQGTAHFREIAWSSDGNFIMLGDEEDGRRFRAVSVATTTVSDLTDALVAGTTAAIGNMWMSPSDFTVVFNYYVPGGGNLYVAQFQADGDTVSVIDGPTQLVADFSVTGHGYALPDWAPYQETGGGDDEGCTSDADCPAWHICTDGTCVAVELLTGHP